MEGIWRQRGKVMPQIPESELIQKAKSGDKEAYRELFDRYVDRILTYLKRYVGDYEKAQDIMIDTFVAVYNSLPKYKEEGKFSSWIYAIATNYAKKEFRKSKYKKEVSLDKPIDEDEETTEGSASLDNRQRPDYQAMEDEFKEALEKALKDLSEPNRKMILLCDVEGLSYEEAAKILKCSKLSVGARLHRARKLLYEILQKKGYDL